MPQPEPESFWADVLSGRPEQVRRAVERLTPEERGEVVAHLRRMVRESGWQSGQRAHAQAALAALDGPPDGSESPHPHEPGADHV